MKASDDLVLKSEPASVKNISVGFSEKNILLMFNVNENNDSEYACTLKAEKLRELIAMLYKCGVTYEQEYCKDIGFGVERGE